MITTHRATREAKGAISETGLASVTGRVFSKRWEAPGEVRTVIHMADPYRREDVIDALQKAFPDIHQVYRLDRNDSVATYCAIAIHRLT